MSISGELRNNFDMALQSLSPQYQAMFDYIISNPDEVKKFEKNERLFSFENYKLLDDAKKENNQVSEEFVTKLLGSRKEPFEIAGRISDFVDKINICTNRKISKLDLALSSFTQKDILNQRINQEIDAIRMNPAIAESVPVQNIPNPPTLNAFRPTRATEINQTPPQANEISDPFKQKLNKFLEEKNASGIIDLESYAITKLSEKYSSNQKHKPNFLKSIKEGKEIESLCKKAGLGSSGELHKETRDFIKALCLGKEPSQAKSQER